MVTTIDEGRVNFNFKKSAWEISFRKTAQSAGNKKPCKQSTGLEVTATLPCGAEITTSSELEDLCHRQLKKARMKWNNMDGTEAERYTDSYL
jgi:hypothetical protein